MQNSLCRQTRNDVWSMIVQLLYADRLWPEINIADRLWPEINIW